MEDDTFFFLLGRRRGLPQSDGDYPGDGYLWTPKLSGRLRKERYATTRKRATSGAPVLPTNGALQVRH